MFSMFNQIFRSIQQLFSALEKFGLTLNNLGDIGVEMSKSYAEEQAILRVANNKKLKLEHNVE